MKIGSIFGMILAPLLSLVFFALGIAFFTTLVSLHLQDSGYTPSVVTWVQVGYFLGIFVGGMLAERVIAKLGHIQAVALIGSTLCAAMLLMDLHVHPLSWFMLRVIHGALAALMYTVVESWLLGRATAATRGAILGIYMTALYFAQGISQILYYIVHELHISDISVGVFFAALSVIPITLSFKTAPDISEMEKIFFKKLFDVSPLGMVTCFVAGMIQAVQYALVPLVGKVVGVHGSLLIAATILGAVTLQYPIGYISDRLNRRHVIIAASSVMSALASILYFSSELPTLFLVGTFLLGGFSFSINPLGMALVCDRINLKQTTSVIASLVIVYGMGAAMGPFLMAPLIESALSIYLFIAFAGIFITLCAAVRHFFSEHPSHHGHFQPISSVVPTAVSELDPRVPIEESFLGALGECEKTTPEREG